MLQNILQKLKEKRLLVVSLLLFFAVNIFVIYTTFSEKTTSSVWDGSIASKFASGSGTSTDPYIINSGSELAYFFTLINGEEHDEYFNKFYEINNNINLNGRSFSFASDKSFSGSLNGNGYSIFNFKIDKYYLSEDNSEANYALFNNLFGADIKNINFSDITFEVNKVDDVILKLVVEKEPENIVNTEEDTEIKDNSNPTESKDNEVDSTSTTEKSDKSETESVTNNDKVETESVIENKKVEESETEKDEVIEKIESDSNISTDSEKSSNDEDPNVSSDEKESITSEKTVEEEVIEKKIVIEKVNVGLIKDMQESSISNISINNIKLVNKQDEKEVNSSLFVLNDKENNTFKNIVIVGNSELENTTLFINSYNDSELENIIWSNTGLELIKNYDYNNDENIYEYYINNGKLYFFGNYPVKSMLNLLNSGSSLKWKLEDNTFRLQNNGKNDGRKLVAKKSLRSAPSAHASGIEGTTVYVNDYESDANYYEGLNYTYSSNGTIPTTENKNVYGDTNLVYTQINYHGTDINGNYTGTVSISETENQFIYYKVYVVNNNGTTGDNSDDYIEVDLIDNPFARRPNNKVFQGWITDEEDVEITLDTDVYVRRAKIPVSYSGNNPSNIVIDFYSVWGNGKVTTYSSSWSNTFSNLDASGFHPIAHSTDVLNYENVYVSTTIDRGAAYPSGAVDQYGDALTGNCSRYSYYGCSCYVPFSGTYNNSNYYYTLQGGIMTRVYPTVVGNNYVSEVPIGETISGYYRNVNIPRNASLAGYYNTNGELLTSGTCTTSGGCNNYYELIQYYDANGDAEVVVEGGGYYYKTTRDTNIVVMNSTVTSTWGSSQNKPVTITAINNGTSYINTYYWNLRNNDYVICYADTRIEQIRANGATRVSDDTTPATYSARYSDPEYSGIYGNYYNLKLGRGITAYDSSRTSFTYAVGGNISNTGSSSSFTKHTFIVESGVYNNLGLTSTGGNTNYIGTRNMYVDSYGTFGCDYDRVNDEDNDKLTVVYCLSGSWYGNVHGQNITTPMLHTTVKSGQFGTNKADYAAGIYVGGRNSGSHDAPREIVVEGGYIYNLIGGPLSQTSIKNYNDSYIYVKGGSIDIIIGGAGRSETYGNRIIQVTGGTINYAVFGGSNGIEGDDTQYTSTVDGDTYIYIGGTATIGDEDLVSNNSIEPNSEVEAGSVFGIGNGKSGHDSIGTANNSNIVINSSATINRNVYGGGNYGATGQNGSNKTYATNIVVNGGDIQGSVYGGGNNNGAGTTSNTCNVNITMKDGNVHGSVYGGSRTKGRIYGSTNVNVLGGKVYTDVYGGGEGGYTDSTNYGTFVNGNVSVNIGQSTSGPTINGNVYGGSAYGTVNATSINPSSNRKTVNVTVNNGNVIGSVFGGAKGSSSFTPYVAGPITVTVNNGTINNVFGGFDEAGKPASDATVYINGGVTTNVYGGGNKTSIDNTHVYLRGGGVTTMYGGSNQQGDVLKTNISIEGGQVATVFGGNNEGGTCSETNVSVTGGSITTALYGGGNLVDTGTTKIDVYNVNNIVPNIYGGGNQAGATTTTINLHKQSGNNNINVTNVYGGSNQDGLVTTSNVTVEHGAIGNVFGGGNSVGVTTTNVTVSTDSSITVTNIYGGSNQTGDVTTSNVTINTGTIGNVYGSNNAGGSTGTTNITINNGTITDSVYGGGNEAEAGTTYVTMYNGSATTIYGGGNKADVTTTNVTLNGGTTTTIFGGGNEAKADDTHVTINNGTSTTVYGGGNKADVETTTVILNGGTTTTIFGGGNEAKADDTSVTINNGAVSNIYGGGNQAVVNNETNVTITGVSNTITNVFGGGNQAGATVTNVTVTPTNGNVNITNVFGGSNQSGTVGTSNVQVDNGTIDVLYGGNNAGGTTTNANVEVNNGTITSVYGGGNQAQTNTTDVKVTNGTINILYGGGNAANVTGNTKIDMTGGTVSTYIYGGGNQGSVLGSTDVKISNANAGISAFGGGNGSTANVNGNTSLKIYNSTTTGNIYGGGNNGKVLGSTNVVINNGTIGGSAYAGGNGSSATVMGNTNILVGGTTSVGSPSCTVLSTCSVFGGGNAAITGSESTNNSIASVNIAGATIYGNVYGGANTSKVFGQTMVNIGDDVTLVNDVTKGNVAITGTVFGGGEANASGSDVYDWTFVSVTRGTNVSINGNNREVFTIVGSIFGSGNASTTSGPSLITIKNYGTFSNPKKNTSIQRCDKVVIDNSSIILKGATDRENEFSDVLFSLSRIDELDLVNNSTLYLETGANLLQEFKSLTSSGDKAAVTINKDTGNVTKNTDNRIYMLTAKVQNVLNIAKNQNVTDYGEVSGMTFFGMYRYDSNNNIYRGIYDKHDYGDTLDWGGVFDNVTAYVLGLHKTNHDIEVDGFYSNYMDEETSTNMMDYITPTPPTGPLYMWTIGEGVIEYTVELSASKYSTLGTTELSLRDFTDPNTSFQVLGFDYSELESGIQLIEKRNVKKIADTENEANTIFGLSMETSNIGWLVNGSTSFLSDSNESVKGTEEYIGGNNEGAPSLLFYLHHSKNVSNSGSLGKVRIQLMSIRQIDALTKETKRLIITVEMSRTLISTVDYEGAMTAGRKYDLFTSTATNITSSSSISAYYSLFNVGSNTYREGYHRALVSTYVLPLDTKITMIDLSGNNPEYYYHVIDNVDVARATADVAAVGETDYKLSLFEAMGALNSGVYYNDATKNVSYCSTGNYCNEDFVFIIDFGDTNITADQLRNKLLIEMLNADEDTIYSVLAPQHDNLTYNVYVDRDALIDINGTIDKEKIYAGEAMIADLEIDYTQSMVGSVVIYDTHYFDSKLGIKVSLLNEDLSVVPGTTLLGLYYQIDGVRYYPNIDGTTRIKVADKVDSAEKWLIVNTGTSKIASGNYILRVESFGSPDGIYYGLNSSDHVDFNIEIVNEIYGLDIETTSEEMIIDASTGLNANEENSIIYNVSYNSGLRNPKLNFKMYRRNYDEVYDTTWTLVDAKDYFSGALSNGFVEKEYVALQRPTDNSSFTFNLKDNLISGTYKLEFILYDDSSAIGTVVKYIIIK